MRIVVFAGVLAAVVLLGACSSEPPPPPQAREQDKALQQAIQQPLDTARAVEDEVLKAQEEQQRKIDEQGG